MTDQSKNILIIEDDRTMAIALQDAIATSDIKAQIVASGEEGLAVSKKDQPDLIILDLLLGQLTGVEVLTAIRQEGTWGSHVPIIVLSSITHLDQIKEVKKLATRYISKSDFEMTKLIELINLLLAGKKS